MARKAKDQYLLEVRQTIDHLKARANLPGLCYSAKVQDRIILHFVNRAIQIGEACFRIADLRTPILILSRVLCEDFFRLFWISRSEGGAAEYARYSATAELAKGAQVQLHRGRAKIVKKSTGENVTATLMPELSKLIVIKKTVEQIAKESGLEKLYDIVYRFDSLEVHANTFGVLTQGHDEEALLAAFPSIIAFLEAVILITDNRTTTAEEILRHLRIDKLGGK